MGWIIVLSIWLAAPFAELGIIVGLLISNDRYKKRVSQLEGEKRRYMAVLGSSGCNQPYRAERDAQPIGRAGEQEERAGEAAERSSGTEESSAEAAERNRGAEELSAAPSAEAVQWNSGAEEPSAKPPQWNSGTAESSARPSQWNSMAEKPSAKPAQWNSRTADSKPVSASAQRGKSWERPAVQAAGNMPVFTGDSIPTAGQARLGTAALIMGVVFVVLAGLIFATTTWKVLPDICKTILVLVCSILFFTASFAAERLFHVRKTGNAFYILGSIFLFFSVLTAAYFKLLGAGFILDGTNRWKVLWIGSGVTLGAFWAGLKRFSDRLYTQSCLWGITLSLFFMAKAFSVTWSGFVCMMMVYSAVLITIKELWSTGEEAVKAGDFRALLRQGFLPFAVIHFWTFGAVVALGSLTPIWRMAAEGWLGIANPILDRLPMFAFSASKTASMAALAVGICVVAWREEQEIYRNLRFAALAGLVLYGAGWMTSDFICRMAVINTVFFAAVSAGYLRKEDGRNLHTLPMDICGCGAALSSIIGFYSAKSGSGGSLCLTVAAAAVYYLWFYLGERQWPHLLIALALVPFPFIAEIRMDLAAGQIQAWMAALLVTGIGARCFFPVARRDGRVQGQWRMDWYHIFSGWTILWMAATGDDVWQFFYTLLAALYFVQYRFMDALGKPALFLSACCAAMAVWKQPFVLWPYVLCLEMNLLPAAWLLWTAGLIWKEKPWISGMQRTGYVVCLIILCLDAVFTGDVRDTLILEGLSLTVFILAQIKKDVWWVQVSGGILLAAALFMTRNFWLSISWWVYLLSAGIGLIIFAGILERRRK